MLSSGFSGHGGGGDLPPTPPPPQSPTHSQLDLVVRGRKAKVAWVVVTFTVVEVVVCIMSIDRLAKSSMGEDSMGGMKTTVLMLEKQDDEDDEIDSGIIEVILFALPFMLVTNLLVILALTRDNVWLLLPWMVLHCVVIAFLTLGAAILSVHRRFVLGSTSLFSALLLLCCWKALRQLFMKMVDRQLKSGDIGEGEEEEGRGIEEDEPSKEMRHRHELIFFGSKDRKFMSHKETTAAAAAAAAAAATGGSGKN